MYCDLWPYVWLVSIQVNLLFYIAGMCPSFSLIKLEILMLRKQVSLKIRLPVYVSDDLAWLRASNHNRSAGHATMIDHHRNKQIFRP